MPIGLKLSGEKLVEYGNFELRRTSNGFLLVRNGIGIMLLNKREIVELYRLLETYLKQEKQARKG